jgi:DNA-binding winged helix-turn-helix (wHTH) protein
MQYKLPLMIIAAAALFFLLAFANGKKGQSDFEETKEVLVMRKIAHRILQYAGDSTSPIMPIKQLSDKEYQIPFEGSFSFKPDSLVKIIDELMVRHQLSSNYIVEVKENGKDELVYGYAFLGSEPKNIVPCTGRNQANKRYCINIRFQEKELISTKTLYLSGISLVGIAVLLFGLIGFKKKKVTDNVQDLELVVEEKKSIVIGKFLFYPSEQLLTFKDEKIVLSVKETKLLNIFASSPNHTIDRSRLQKEVWEDEGVIVGRSLDMFISKLRKKLENDTNVNLTNIHGKGYKLEVRKEDKNS